MTLDWCRAGQASSPAQWQPEPASWCPARPLYGRRRESYALAWLVRRRAVAGRV